jgi:hypothetical protein
MSSQDYTTTFVVDQSPAQVFDAITNVRGWWNGDIEGSTGNLGDEFTYSYQDVHYSRQKITELTPGKKIAWHVLDARLKFAEDPREWTGTDVTFEIMQQGEQTEVRFAHQGLIPGLDCFDSCSSAWAFFIGGNLRRLITGEPPVAPPWG